MVKCPRCGIEVTDVHEVDPGLAEKLTAAGETVPEAACSPCMSELRKLTSRATGGVLLAQERAADQRRIQMWKSRVSLLKKARSLMSQKAYSQAAVAYEKYIKILEIVFKVKPGENITPEIFKENARTSELTVVTSVYWDLLRIYDTNDKYKDRQLVAAKQLAHFVRFTPIYPDIVKRAEVFQKQAKNPDAIKSFLKHASGQGSRCFIATAAFCSPQSVEVLYLRSYRDTFLKTTPLGRHFIKLYYRYSPPVASWLDRHTAFKPATRWALRLVISVLKAHNSCQKS